MYSIVYLQPNSYRGRHWFLSVIGIMEIPTRSDILQIMKSSCCFQVNIRPPCTTARAVSRCAHRSSALWSYRFCSSSLPETYSTDNARVSTRNIWYYIIMSKCNDAYYYTTTIWRWGWGWGRGFWWFKCKRLS